MAERLGFKEKWKVFEELWQRKYMRNDYNLALTQRQSYKFQSPGAHASGLFCSCFLHTTKN